MGNGFTKDKLKVKSKMAANRIKLHQGKMENMLAKSRREIAVLVGQGKARKGRIKCEGVIRSENLISVYDIMEDMCNLLHQRATFIAQENDCPADLLEIVCTIFYAAPRSEIKELNELCELFGAKYGKKFVQQHKENKSGMVSSRIVNGLSTAPPPAADVIEKLKEICAENSVPFDASELDSITEEIPSARNTETQTVNQDTVNMCVRYLMDPSTFDMSDEQKIDFCATYGANSAEAAAALHVAKRQIAEQQVSAQNIKPVAQPTGQEYTIVFPQRPFGMQWTETSNQMNLYVSSVDIGGQAHQKGVREGSLIIAVNGQPVENIGAAQIFQISKARPLPLQLTFRALANTNNPAPMVQPVQPMMPMVQQQPQIAPPAYNMVPQNNYAPPPAQPSNPGLSAFDLPSVPGQPGGGLDAFDLPSVPGQPGGNEGASTAPGNEANNSTTSSAQYDDLEARFAALRNGL